jgi:hypothetical protein
MKKAIQSDYATSEVIWTIQDIIVLIFFASESRRSSYSLYQIKTCNSEYLSTASHVARALALVSNKPNRVNLDPPEQEIMSILSWYEYYAWPRNPPLQKL